MTNVEKYQELIRRIEEAKARQSEAKGSLNEIKDRLQKTYGCSTLKEAKAKLEKLSEEYELAVIEVDTLMEDMEEALANANLD